MAFTGDQIVNMEWERRRWERIERERKESQLPYHEIDKALVDQVRDKSIYLKVDEIAEALGEKTNHGRFVLDYGWEPLGKKLVFERDGLKITKVWRGTGVSYNGDNIYAHSFRINADRWLMKERGSLPRIHIYKPGEWEEILNSAYQEIPKTHGGQ